MPDPVQGQSDQGKGHGVREHTPIRAPKKKYTVAVDFDGVIHRYDTPWVAADVIPDGPVEGAIEWLNEIDKRFEVVIFTTRGKTPEGRMAVMGWLKKHGVHHALTMGHFRVTAEKPPALIYLDDRAVRFDGKHFPSPQEIHEMKPWHKACHGPRKARTHMANQYITDIYAGARDAYLSLLDQIEERAEPVPDRCPSCGLRGIVGLCDDPWHSTPQREES